MKLSTTLSRYLARSYFFNFIVLLLALLSIIYLFDTVELIRRGSNKPDVTLGLLMKMGLLKLPEVGQTLFPFAILFSAMVTFWQLTRRSELIVARSSGFSAWQFLMPIMTVAIAIGLLQIAVINPMGALLLGKFDQLENTYLKKSNNRIALFKEGFWIRQGTEDGYAILHAKKIRNSDWVLDDVSTLFFNEGDDFIKRVDSATAVLEPGQWRFNDVVYSDVGKPSLSMAHFTLLTDLTAKDVEDSFVAPQSMSFWRLRNHIQVLEDAGFDASRLRVYLHHLLSQPLMFVAMILLAASVSMRPPRNRGTLGLVSAGIAIGFVVFFMSSFLQALGATNQIPVVLAAWSPALISFLLGLSAMMVLEDG